MANFILTNIKRFPSGTQIDAYDAGGFDYFPGLGPLGAVVESQTTNADGATFTALTAGKRYYFVDNGDATVYVSGTAGEDSITFDSIRDNTLIGLSLGAPDLSDDDRFLESVNMQATAYTLDATTLPADNPPRNVIVTHTAGATADTLGDAVITGTNVNDETITETITISSGGVATGAKAFKTVTEVVTADWVIDGAEGTEDTIKVGFGNLLGLDRPLAGTSQVFLAALGAALVVPTVAVDGAEVEENTIDISSGTYNGSKAAKALVIP